MIHRKIEKLIPFIEEEFITYPLWEEGKFVPFVNFWQKLENPKDVKDFELKLSGIKKLGYEFDKSTTHRFKIYNYEIYPNFEEREDGSVEFENKKWSIEEMVELLVSIVS
jgi:hypothetical protein